MSIFELWLLFVVIPAVGSFGVALGFFASIMLLVAIFFYIYREDEDIIKLGISYVPFKNAFIILAICSAILGTLPNEKQIALIIGGSIATNTEGAEKLPENLVKAANSFLEHIQDDSKSK